MEQDLALAVDFEFKQVQTSINDVNLIFFVLKFIKDFIFFKVGFYIKLVMRIHLKRQDLTVVRGVDLLNCHHKLLILDNHLYIMNCVSGAVFSDKVDSILQASVYLKLDLCSFD